MILPWSAACGSHHRRVNAHRNATSGARPQSRPIVCDDPPFCDGASFQKPVPGFHAERRQARGSHVHASSRSSGKTPQDRHRPKSESARPHYAPTPPDGRGTTHCRRSASHDSVGYCLLAGIGADSAGQKNSTFFLIFALTKSRLPMSCRTTS